MTPTPRRVTGSRAGAILGLAPYQTREDVLRSMVRKAHGAEDEFKGNIATEWGNRYEETAITYFTLKTGISVTPNTTLFRIDDWAGAIPDGITSDGGILEVKCPFGARKTGKFKTIAEQPHYYAQMQLEMIATGCKHGWFYQWSPVGDVAEKVILDQAWIDTAMPELRQFYAFYLSELNNPDHLEPLRKEINTKEAALLIAEYDEMKEAKDRADDRLKEIIERLIEMSGDRNALVSGRKLTKVEKEGAISYAKAIKELAPNADLDKYRGKSSVSWRLT